MRWKLIVVASMLAAIAGVGLSLALFLGLMRYGAALGEEVTYASLFLFPTLAMFSAAVFVYRHTARRRGWQAALTALLVTLMVAALTFALRLLR